MMQMRAIFLVEDNDDEADLAARAFQKAKVRNPLVRARDGVDALDYLFAREKYADRDVHDQPAFMLLDLNLPKIDGIEVLKAMRADERTKHIPVVVLTSSNEEKDRMNAYDSMANSYVLKPVDYDQFVETALQLSLYWTKLNAPPPGKSA